MIISLVVEEKPKLIELLSKIVNNITKRGDIEIDYEKNIYTLHHGCFSIQICPNGTVKIIIDGNKLAEYPLEKSLHVILTLRMMTPLKLNEEEYKKIKKQILRKIRALNEEIDKKYYEIAKEIKSKSKEFSKVEVDINKLYEIIKTIKEVLFKKYKEPKIIEFTEGLSFVIFYKSFKLYKPSNNGIALQVFENKAKKIYQVDYRVYINNQEIESGSIYRKFEHLNDLEQVIKNKIIEITKKYFPNIQLKGEDIESPNENLEIKKEDVTKHEKKEKKYEEKKQTQQSNCNICKEKINLEVKLGKLDEYKRQIRKDYNPKAIRWMLGSKWR